jgi:cardiolipin synthase
VSFPGPLLWLPNLITLARLLAVPVGVYLILVDKYTSAFWLFLVAGLSDAADGFIAKRFGADSVIGAYLDPLADKALLVSVYLTLGHMGHVPVWLVILIVFRDLLIIGGAILFHTLGYPIKIKPLLVSKVNTAAQIVLAAMVLAELGLGAPLRSLSVPVFYIVAATTLVSGAAYIVTLGWNALRIEGEP